MPRKPRKSREELGELSRLLLDLRTRAELKQPDAAAEVGISQSMLSRMETGQKVPDVDTARSLAALYKATPDERERLIEVVARLAPVRVNSRMIMQRGENLHFQGRVKDIESEAALVRSYQPGMIIGSLQTADYARMVFTAPRPDRPKNADSPSDLVRARTARYQQLSDPSTRYVLLQTEGSLNWHVGSPAIMAAQMDRLTEASHLANVRLGIIPARTLSRVLASHGFHIYDSKAVHIGTKTATALSTTESDISAYEALFAELEAIAVFDDQARAIVRSVADAYRSM